MAAAQQCLALFKKPTLEPPHIVKIFYWRSREINEIVYDNNISLIRHVVVKIATINLCPYIFHTNIALFTAEHYWYSALCSSVEYIIPLLKGRVYIQIDLIQIYHTTLLDINDLLPVK